jgi:hypothetical protein
MAKLEKGDYYTEDGLIVFTEQFHRKRGYCCRCGCRHCPWATGNPDLIAPPQDPAPASVQLDTFPP